jgi:hypothetical protein
MLSNLQFQKTSFEKQDPIISNEIDKNKKTSHKKIKEEKRKLVLLLLNRAGMILFLILEKRFSFGKFNDSYCDCIQAEKLAREINLDTSILSQ